MTASIDGLVSGLDTTQIINSLLSIERQSQNRLKLAKTAEQAVVAAYQSLNTRFGALRTAADALATAASWRAVRATSSSAAVTAQAASGAGVGTLTFTVDRLATAQSLISSGSVSDPSEIVASGPITISQAGAESPTVVDVGDGSLAAVAAAINASQAGISATVLKVAPGAYRLQLTSTATGTAGAITVDPPSLGSLGAFEVLTAAQDAQITLGSGPGAITMTSGSNTISDLAPGLTLTLRQAGPDPVTVTIAADGEGLADRVEAMVKAANDLLGDIQKATAYDPDTREAGLLLGDSAVRRLHDQVVDSVVAAVGASSLGSAGNAGVSFQRDGTVSFDRDKFLSAYSASPDAVAALFRQGGTSTSPAITLRSAGPNTATGDHTVVITRAAERAEATGAVVAGGTITADETIDIAVGGASITYSATAGQTLTSIADGLTVAAAGASLGVVATVEGGALVLRSTGYGAAATFDVRSSASGAGQTGIVAAAGAYETHSGVDVAGTIDGVACTGLGQMLTAPASDPGLGGLSLGVALTPAEVAAPVTETFTYQPGVAQRLSSTSWLATDTTSGLLTNAIASRRDHMSDLDDQIAKWDDRLAMKEATLRSQFAALEATLGQLRSQSNWLNSQIAQLPKAGQDG